MLNVYVNVCIKAEIIKHKEINDMWDPSVCAMLNTSEVSLLAPHIESIKLYIISSEGIRFLKDPQSNNIQFLCNVTSDLANHNITGNLNTVWTQNTDIPFNYHKMLPRHEKVKR